MTRRMVRRMDLRPFVVLAVILLVGTVAGRLFSGVVSVLVMITVAVLGPMIAVTFHTVGVDSRRTARLSERWWHALPPTVPAPPASTPARSVGSVADAKDAA